MPRPKKRLVDLHALGLSAVPDVPIEKAVLVAASNDSQAIEKLFTITPIRMNGTMLHKLVMVSMCNGREVARVDLCEPDSTHTALANAHQAFYDVFVEQREPKSVREGKHV
jgi:hypothetical protein